MVWAQAAAAIGKKFVKKKAIDFGKKKALEVGQRHLAKEQRKAVRREKIGYGERGSARYARKPMDIENV